MNKHDLARIVTCSVINGLVKIKNKDNTPILQYWYLMDDTGVKAQAVHNALTREIELMFVEYAKEFKETLNMPQHLVVIRCDDLGIARMYNRAVKYFASTKCLPQWTPDLIFSVTNNKITVEGIPNQETAKRLEYFIEGIEWYIANVKD